jgi:hypothetical protein
MKKRVLSQSEIENLVSLKQRKYSWLRIERETGVPRRTAKRAYEQWEHTRVANDLKAARVHVAEDLLREHLSDLVALAHNMVTNFPTKIMLGEQRTADDVIESILNLELRTDDNSIEGAPFRDEREQNRTRRQNRVLFDALRQHTVETVRWVKLDSWMKLWNEGVSIQQEICDNSHELLANMIRSNKKQETLKSVLFTGEKGKNLIDKMSHGITESVWSGILHGEIGYENIMKSDSQAGEITVRFGQRASNVNIVVKNDTDAEYIAALCRQAAEMLWHQKFISRAADINSSIAEAVADLEDDLSTIKLKAILLRSRCELCPA